MTKNYKIYIFAPREDELIRTIIDVAAKAGAGTIGNYSHCAFVSEGTGHYIPLENAQPHIGEIGVLASTPEVKIEMQCPESALNDILAAVKAVHPYEEVVIDIIELQ
jgi:hypothetical protein